VLTFQDFQAATDKTEFLSRLISEHQSSPAVRMAHTADEYDRQRNVGIRKFNRLLGEAYKRGSVVTGSRNEICSNFYARLNTQRVTYSLGNGLQFGEKGKDTDSIKAMLGVEADKRIKDAGYFALIHGLSFCFWASDHIELFKLPEFAPLWDEHNGMLGAGIRYWRLAPDKPMQAILYEVDGYTKYSTIGSGNTLQVEQEKQAYNREIAYTVKGVDDEVICADNYSALPVVPLYGSRLKQSTLVGVQATIDAYDLVMSGFANDLQDCTQIYWIVENYGGSTDKDLSEFLNKIKMNHIVEADTTEQGKITPYTQEVPYQARQQLLTSLRSQIYEDFGGLDVHTIAAGATNDHIDAAYQAVDEQADDFEYQIISLVQQLLALQGVDKKEATPLFKRNRLSNYQEQTDMVINAKTAGIIDADAALNHIPWITPDEVAGILERLSAEDLERFNAAQQEPTNKQQEGQQ